MTHAKTAIVVFGVGLFGLLGLWLAFDDKCDGCDNLTIAAETPLSPSAEAEGELDTPVDDGLLRVADSNQTSGQREQTEGTGDSETGPTPSGNDGDAEDFIDDIGQRRGNGVVDLLVDPRSATATTVGGSSSEEETNGGQDGGDDGGTDTGSESGNDGQTDTTIGDANGPTTTTDEPVDGETTTSIPYPATVAGPEIYVDPLAGSDDQAGSSETTAFKSLQRALDVVKPGQTIRLMTGEYREARAPGELHYYLGRSGRSDAWVRISAAAGHKPEIVATSGTALFINANFVEISGLVIRGEGFDQANSWGVGISVPNVHHIRMIGNRISGMPAGGISVVGSSNYQILNNTVVENALWSDVAGSGITIFEAKDHNFGPDVGKYHDLIVGNRVFRNENRVPSKWQNHQILTDGNGIIIDSSKASGYNNWTLVANNLAVDNGSRGIIVWESSRVDVMFNTTYHNARTTNMGGRVEIAAGRSTDVRLAHNTAWARPGIRAAVFADDPSVTSEGNVFITNNTSSKSDQTDTVYSTDSPTNVLVNPSTNLGSADFRPIEDGPLAASVNGSQSGPLANDATGTARGDTAEPGAFEANASRGS